MTVEAMALVLHHSKAKANARLVMIGIANHDGDGGSWPSVETLAKYALVSERTVQRMVDELVTLGEITVHYNDGGNHHTRNDQRPNRYVINLACPDDCDGTTKHRKRGDNSVTPLRGRGDNADVDGATAVSPEPSINHPHPSELVSLGTDRATPVAAEDGGSGHVDSLRSSRVPVQTGCTRHAGRMDPTCRGCRKATEHAEAPAVRENLAAAAAAAHEQQEKHRAEAANRRHNAAPAEVIASAAAKIRADIRAAKHQNMTEGEDVA